MSALLIKAKQKLLEEARRRFESYKNDGSGPIATLSPSPVGLIDAFIDNIELDQNSIVIELGCGDARWMHAISRRFKCACVLGIEIDERRLLDGRRESGEYVMGDFFSCINLSMATHIIFYLSVEGNKRVYEKVLKECTACTSGNDGSNAVVLVAVGFQVIGLKPVSIHKASGLVVYKYILLGQNQDKEENTCIDIQIGTQKGTTGI